MNSRSSLLVFGSALCAVLLAPRGDAIGFWDGHYFGVLNTIEENYQDGVLTALGSEGESNSLELNVGGDALWQGTFAGAWKAAKNDSHASAKFDAAYHVGVQESYPDGSVKKAKSRVDSIHKLEPQGSLFAATLDFAKVKNAGIVLKFVSNGLFVGDQP